MPMVSSRCMKIHLPTILLATNQDFILKQEIKSLSAQLSWVSSEESTTHSRSQVQSSRHLASVFTELQLMQLLHRSIAISLKLLLAKCFPNKIPSLRISERINGKSRGLGFNIRPNVFNHGHKLIPHPVTCHDKTTKQLSNTVAAV